MYSYMDVTTVNTPVNIPMLNRLLHESEYDRDETRFLIQGFAEGFDIGYCGNKNRQNTSANLPLTVGNKEILWNKIMKEVKEKRVAGPFNTIPFSNYIQSPIGLVPKTGNQTRLIFHLSYNFSGTETSVNANTPAEWCTVQYHDLDYAVDSALRVLEQTWGRYEPGSTQGYQGRLFFGASDLRSAYRMLPLAPESWPLVIMKAVNPVTNMTQYLVEKHLPFGGSISCSHFQRFSNALKHLVEYSTGGRYRVTNYLDDFLFVAETRSRCNYLVREFLRICELIHFLVSMEKTEWASTQVVFLGILLDGESKTLAVPENKRQKAINLLSNFMDRKRATVHELQALCGYLNFLNRAIFAGRAFTRRMYAKYAVIVRNGQDAKLKKHHHVRLDKEFKFDCAVWKKFLTCPDAIVLNRPMIDRHAFKTAKEIRFYSDASAGENRGFGCILGKNWLFSQWEPGYICMYKPSINYLELYALCAGILTWEEQLKNCRITIFCNNTSALGMVNEFTSSCPNCMFLLRMLALNGLQYNRRIFVKYVESAKNDLADSLSRIQLNRFRKLDPGMKRFPDKISDKLYPPSKAWQKL